MLMKRLFIYCCGGLGREVLELAREINDIYKKWNEICFIDDNKINNVVNDAKVYSYDNVVNNNSILDFEVIIASGEPQFRKKLYEKLKKNNIKIATLIHPNCRISKYNIIGEGCIIMNGVMLTTNITLENCIIVNLSSTIGHDVLIKNFCTISPNCNISGETRIGSCTYIGTGVSIRDEISIGKNAIIGIGSVVTKDIPDNVIAYGNPAKVIKPNIKQLVFREKGE